MCKFDIHFLRAGSYAKCEVSVSETVVSLSDGDGVQLACLLQTSDQKQKLEILKQLCKSFERR